MIIFQISKDFGQLIMRLEGFETWRFKKLCRKTLKCEADADADVDADKKLRQDDNSSFLYFRNGELKILAQVILSVLGHLNSLPNTLILFYVYMYLSNKTHYENMRIQI